jgi:cytochrome c
VRPAAPTLALVVAAALGAAPAWASEDLAEQHGCSNCHRVDRKLVGPAYSAIASKYRDQPGAEEMLLAKVMQGGGGVWGPVAMPSMAHVPLSDVRALVAWILKQPQ